jgi:cysteine desulfurase
LSNTDWNKIFELKIFLKDGLQNNFPSILFNGHPENSLPNILNISFDSTKIRVDGESLILGMDLEGIAVSSGSACTSGSVKPSHVLLAMGRVLETAKATIRFSLGRSTTKEDISHAIRVLTNVLGRVTYPR